MKITKIVVHHAAMPRDTTKKADVERVHIKRGFSQIGYHKVIEGNGLVRDGRPITIMGAHAKGANVGSLGICVTGNFEDEFPSASQIASLVTLLTQWCMKYGTTATLCPGKNMKSKLEGIKAKVRHNLTRKKYRIESLIKDPSVKRTLQKALDDDGRISYDEVKRILRSTLDYKTVSRAEVADMKTILKNSSSIDTRSKQLIEQFTRNPKSLKF
jgi:hypothetical protein